MINYPSKYIPFARKYRPKNFSELLGQEILVKILSYAINNDRLAHSYLLTGIRGVGKTSSARLIAKTVNCSAKQQEANSIFPCEKCDNCLSFNRYNHPDIIEMDAASKTGVEDVRKIIEASEYKPLLGGKKFFIIDEVHMLSKNAFNALLKIIEEPPNYVIFIFATTEIQKIPATIISRCQRYDLRRLNFDEIIKLLSNITKAEKIKIAGDALKIIAIKSEGSARDAVKLLDQAASHYYYAGKDGVITAKSVENMLGMVEFRAVFELVQCIIKGEAAVAIKLLTEIYHTTSNLELLLEAVTDFFAELTKTKIVRDYQNPLHSNYQADITLLANQLNLAKLSLIWQIFHQDLPAIRQSHNQLIAAEMLLIKAIYACNIPALEELYELENLVSNEATSLGTKKEETIEQPSLKDLTTPIQLIDNKQEKKVEQRETKAISPAPSPVSPAKVTKSSKNHITEENSVAFLKYCQQHTEIEVYYKLFNNLEILNFADNILHLAGNLEINLKKSLIKLLSNWSGKKWEILVEAKSHINSLKAKLMARVNESDAYKLIEDKFPAIEISDIVFET